MNEIIKHFEARINYLMQKVTILEKKVAKIEGKKD